MHKALGLTARHTGCASARVHALVNVRVRTCLVARICECASARTCECVRAQVRAFVGVRVGVCAVRNAWVRTLMQMQFCECAWIRYGSFIAFVPRRLLVIRTFKPARLCLFTAPQCKLGRYHCYITQEDGAFMDEKFSCKKQTYNLIVIQNRHLSFSSWVISDPAGTF